MLVLADCVNALIDVMLAPLLAISTAIDELTDVKEPDIKSPAVDVNVLIPEPSISITPDTPAQEDELKYACIDDELTDIVVSSEPL